MSNKLELTMQDLVIINDTLFKSKSTSSVNWSFSVDPRMSVHSKIKKYLQRTPVKVGRDRGGNNE